MNDDYSIDPGTPGGAVEDTTGGHVHRTPVAAAMEERLLQAEGLNFSTASNQAAASLFLNFSRFRLDEALINLIICKWMDAYAYPTERAIKPELYSVRGL